MNKECYDPLLGLPLSRNVRGWGCLNVIKIGKLLDRLQGLGVSGEREMD